MVESSNKDGKETFMTTPAPQKNVSMIDKNAPPALIIEEDDPTIPISPGTLCRRKGCGVSFISDKESRQGDGPGTICIYHTAPVGWGISGDTRLMSGEIDFSPSFEKAARSPAIVTLQLRVH